MTNLRIVFHDKVQDKDIIVEISPFKDGEYVIPTNLNGDQVFHVLADEGYLKTNYFYPRERYEIVSISII